MRFIGYCILQRLFLVAQFWSASFGVFKDRFEFSIFCCMLRQVEEHKQSSQISYHSEDIWQNSHLKKKVPQEDCNDYV